MPPSVSYERMATQRSPNAADPAPASQDPGVVAVRGILTRLSKRSGLSSDRLRGTEIDVGALLDLPIVRENVLRTMRSPEEVVQDVIENAARLLQPTDRLIVDAELSLGLLRGNTEAGIDPALLYAAELGDRRAYLTRNWRQLHEAFGADAIPPAPSSVRTLRGEPERRAFSALAHLLTTATAFGAGPVVRRAHAERGVRGRVTVLGDAVVDHNYVVDRVPVPGSSTWCDLERSPGGKGLNRAVAVAKLGLRAQLIAAVGDDAEGRELLSHLRLRGVDTSLVTTVAAARTPVTAVILPHGELPMNMAYRDDRLRLHANDLDERSRHVALSTADAVLLTFEQPVEVIVRALEIIDARASPCWVVVNASPPLRDSISPRKLYRHLRSVDYMIGTSAELEQLASAHSSAIGTAAERLLGLGVDTVCAIDGFQVTVSSRSGETVVGSVATAMAGTSGAYAAFSAALTFRLVTRGQPARDPDFRWAARAMVATQSVGTVSDALPSAAEIDALMNVDMPRNRD